MNDINEHNLARWPFIEGEAILLRNRQEWLIPSLPLEARWPVRRWWHRWLRRPTTECEIGIFSPDAKACERILDGILADPKRSVPGPEQLRLCIHALRINYLIGPGEAARLIDLKRHFWPFVWALLGRGKWQDAEDSARIGAGSAPAAGTADATPAG